MIKAVYKQVTIIILVFQLMVGCFSPSNANDEEKPVKIFSIEVPEASVVRYAKEVICVEYLPTTNFGEYVYVFNADSMLYILDKINGISPSVCAEIDFYHDSISEMNFLYDDQSNSKFVIKHPDVDKVISHENILITAKRSNETGIYELHAWNQDESVLLKISSNSLDLDFRLVDITGDSRVELIVYQYFPSRTSVDVLIEGYSIPFMEANGWKEK